MMLDAALSLAARGWRVHPLRPRAKVPLTAHGCLDATTDEAQIRRWWERHPKANVGVATGAGSGLVVIDMDSDEAVETWRQLLEEHGRLETLTCRTPRGWHVYLGHPGGTVQGSASRLAPGIDVRGEGGYVVAPPSVHPSGELYHWARGPETLAPCPAWLAEMLAKPPGPPRERRNGNGSTDTGATVSYADAALEREAEAVAQAPEGTRNQALNIAAFNLGQLVGGEVIDQRTVEDTLAAAAREAGLEDREIRSTIASGLRAGMANPRTPPERTYTHATDVSCIPPPSDADAPPELEAEPEDWRELLRVKINQKTGLVTPIGCPANAMIYMRYHPALAGRLALDVRTQRILWTAPPPWDADGEERPIRDSDADEALLWLSTVEGVSLGRDPLWHAIVAEADRRPVDRFRDWLEVLAWDETPRLSGWLTRYAEARDSLYVRAVARAWIISAVARTMAPGCQADSMLVLEGPQGIGKTSILRDLAGSVWHAEISLGVTRDDVMLLHGPVICEWAELAGLSRAELESVKAVTSRRVDRLRLPYARATVDLARRCILAATTNESDWAADRTGNRRYWPVAVGACDPSGIRAAREQLWAEAREAWLSGEQWWLDAETETLAAEEQADRLPDDPWAETILGIISGRWRDRPYLTTEEILDAMDLPKTARTVGATRRVGAILRDRNWSRDRERIGGERVRVWRRPPTGTAPNGPGAVDAQRGGSQRSLYVVSKNPPSGTDGTDI